MKGEPSAAPESAILKCSSEVWVDVLARKMGACIVHVLVQAKREIERKCTWKLRIQRVCVDFISTVSPF